MRTDIIIHNTDKVFIYGLVDPINEEIFYIGKSMHPVARLSDHISRSKAGDLQPKCAERIREITKHGEYPYMLLLCFLDYREEQYSDLENRLISMFMKKGYQLTNRMVNRKR